MNLILASFIVLIVAIPLLLIITQNLDRQSDLTTVKGDQFTMSNTTCVQLTTGCIKSITKVANSTLTNSIGAGNYSLCNINTVKPNYDGILVSGDSSVDAAFNGLTLNATYVESSDCSYVDSGTARNLSTLIPIFFVLAIVVVGIWQSKRTWFWR